MWSELVPQAVTIANTVLLLQGFLQFQNLKKDCTTAFKDVDCPFGFFHASERVYWDSDICIFLMQAKDQNTSRISSEQQDRMEHDLAGAVTRVA